MNPAAPTIDTSAWPIQLADTLLRWALTAQPALSSALQAQLHRCVVQLESERAAGHVCLPLSPEHAARLRATGLVEDDPATPQGRPLVLSADHHLYLHRDFDHERALAQRIAALRAAPPTPIPSSPLRRLFPAAPGDPIDWQAVAVAQALRQRLTVISGGPGTGKTSTVVKLLACALAAHPHARIGLAAPTGKAAQRLLEALRDGAQRLGAWAVEGVEAKHAKAEYRLAAPTSPGCFPWAQEVMPSGAGFSRVAADDLLPPTLLGLQNLALPQEALTVHRLLGAGPQGFAHHADNPLPLDWLIVDEASMLDLALARHLFDALGPVTRLILLGDRHQLAAVENGAVLAELSHAPCWSIATQQALASALGRELPLPAAQTASVLPDLAIAFERSHRFSAASGIGQLAAQVRAGQADAALDLLHRGASDLHWQPEAQDAELDKALSQGFAAYANAVAALWEQPASAPHEAAVWAAWDAFRVLCAGHAGPWGTRAINARCAQQLEHTLQARLPSGCPLSLGQPLLIARNQGPFVNGDIVLLLPAPPGAGTPLEAQLRRGPDTQRFDPQHLPAEPEGAFALTVHKAQGSEFERVLLLLPPLAHPPSREWLYTGATRARKHLHLLGSAQAVSAAIDHPTERRSGLRRALSAPVSAQANTAPPPAQD